MSDGYNICQHTHFGPVCQIASDSTMSKGLCSSHLTMTKKKIVVPEFVIEL